MMDDLAKFGYNRDVKVKNFKHTIHYIFLATIWYRNLNIFIFFKISLLKTPKFTSFGHFQFSSSLSGEIQSVKEGHAGPWVAAVSTHVAEIHSRVTLPKFSGFSSPTLQPQLIGSNDGKSMSIVTESPRGGDHYFSTHLWKHPPTHGSCIEFNARRRRRRRTKSEN